MEHGSVEVKGPLAGRGVALHAGQQLVSSLAEQRLVVDRVSGPSASATTHELPPRTDAQEMRGATSAGQEERPLDGERPLTRGRRARANKLSQSNFAQLVIDGRFEDVLREARGAGIPRVLESAPLEELTALADAARYTRDNELARRALLTLQRRFPASSSGRSAAFFLARVSRGEDTLHWYERYLTREPRGAYASEALGHAMTLYAERGDLDRARAAARRYLALKSNGPYAGSARRVLEDGSSQGR
jgi:hypothetical protein